MAKKKAPTIYTCLRCLKVEVSKYGTYCPECEERNAAYLLQCAKEDEALSAMREDGIETTLVKLMVQVEDLKARVEALSNG